MKILLSLAISITLIIVAMGWWIWQDKELVLNSAMDIREDTPIVIEAGSSLKDIIYELQNRHWLDKPDYLLFEARRLELDSSIKAGEYIIRTGTTPMQFLQQIIAGKVIQHYLALIEGWNFKQVITAIEEHPSIKKTLTDTSPRVIMRVLGKESVAAEGYFFPDTYSFPKGTTDVEFLRRAMQRLESVLDQEWRARAKDLPYKNAYEALIMASIIEKETGQASERDEIAGVFVRRLNIGMKLQTDPTVIYAMGKEYQGNIRKKDLSLDSPFNTYVYPGLPPTPIALAGREAITAALHPKEGKSLYFVSKGDGSHYFSASLQEHNRAVRKFQLKK